MEENRRTTPDSPHHHQPWLPKFYDETVGRYPQPTTCSSNTSLLTAMRCWPCNPSLHDPCNSHNSLGSITPRFRSMTKREQSGWPHSSPSVLLQSKTPCPRPNRKKGANWPPLFRPKDRTYTSWTATTLHGPGFSAGSETSPTTGWVLRTLTPETVYGKTNTRGPRVPLGSSC